VSTQKEFSPKSHCDQSAAVIIDFMNPTKENCEWRGRGMHPKGSRVACAFHSTRPCYKQLFKEPEKKKSFCKSRFLKAEEQIYMFKENKLCRNTGLSCLLQEMDRMLPGAGWNSTEWALGSAHARSPAGLTLCGGCPSNGYAAKCEQGSLFVFVVFSRRCSHQFASSVG